eukprot:m.1352541 g.1352541  ORF g.1352541 m.1352541 type:complete len:2329 (-) comp24925_c2_seq3:262-7248(-)
MPSTQRIGSFVWRYAWTYKRNMRALLVTLILNTLCWSVPHCAEGYVCSGTSPLFVQNHCRLEEGDSSEDDMFAGENTSSVVWNCSHVAVDSIPDFPCNTTGVIVQHANITLLDVGDVNYLDGLTSVDLSNCKITSIHRYAFANMTSLVILDMHGNFLTSLAPRIFQDMTSLIVLDLHGNRISMLPPFVFSGIRNVQVLDLHANEITAVSAGLAGFEYLTRLIVLTMHENVIVCDRWSPDDNPLQTIVDCTGCSCAHATTSVTHDLDMQVLLTTQQGTMQYCGTGDFHVNSTAARHITRRDGSTTLCPPLLSTRELGSANRTLPASDQMCEAASSYMQADIVAPLESLFVDYAGGRRGDRIFYTLRTEQACITQEDTYYCGTPSVGTSYGTSPPNATHAGTSTVMYAPYACLYNSCPATRLCMASTAPECTVLHHLFERLAQGEVLDIRDPSIRSLMANPLVYATLQCSDALCGTAYFSGIEDNVTAELPSIELNLIACSQRCLSHRDCRHFSFFSNVSLLIVHASLREGVDVEAAGYCTLHQPDTVRAVAVLRTHTTFAAAEGFARVHRDECPFLPFDGRGPNATTSDGTFLFRNVAGGTCSHRVHGEIPVPEGLSIDPYTGRLQYVPEPPTAMYVVDVTARDASGQTSNTSLLSYRLIVDASRRFELSSMYTSGVLAGQYSFDFEPPIDPVAYVGEAYVGRSPVVLEEPSRNTSTAATTLTLADMFVSAAEDDYDGVTFRLLFDRVTFVEGMYGEPSGSADANPGFTVDTATGRIVGVPTAGLEGAYVMRLVAADVSGRLVTVQTWRFSVEVRPWFAVSKTWRQEHCTVPVAASSVPLSSTATSSVAHGSTPRTLVPSEEEGSDDVCVPRAGPRTLPPVLFVGETYELAPPTARTVQPCGNVTSIACTGYAEDALVLYVNVAGAVDAIRYALNGSGAARGFTVDSSTGRIVGVPKEAGGPFVLQLVAFDARTRGAVVNTWTFSIRHRGQLHVDASRQVDISSIKRTASDPRLGQAGDRLVYTTWNRSMFAVGVTYYIADVDVPHVLAHTRIGSAPINSSEWTLLFAFEPRLPGFFLDTSTGAMLGTPQQLAQYETTLLLIASRASTTTSLRAPVQHFSLTFALADDTNCSNGPHGKCCVTSSVVADAIEFDSNFSCDCTLLVLDTVSSVDDNCQPVTLSSADSDAQSKALAYGTGVGSAVAGLMLALLIRFRRRHHAQLLGRRKAAVVHQVAGGVALAEIHRRTLTTQWMKDCDYDASQIIFDAFEMGRADMVPLLLKHGADASVRENKTQRLPLMVALIQPAPVFETARALFATYSEIDRQMGVVLSSGSVARDVMANVVLQLAREQWRDPSDGVSTVLHVITNACRTGALPEVAAVTLARSALSADHDMVLRVNRQGRTPGDIAMQCDGAVELERLLTVVVFEHFQLLAPSTPIHKTATSIVMACVDLRDKREITMGQNHSENEDPTSQRTGNRRRLRRLQHPSSVTTSKTSSTSTWSEEHLNRTRDRAAWGHRTLERPSVKPVALGVDDIGKRVTVRGCACKATVRYVGVLPRTDGGPVLHAGVAFDLPVGNCNGTYLGIRHFECADEYGLFTDVGNVLPVDSGTRPWGDACVIKLMASRESWEREIRSRALFRTAVDSIVPAISGACMTTPTAKRKRKGTSVHSIAQKYMSEYPYCICMPQAGRTLHGLIQEERLSGSPMPVLRHCMQSVATCLLRIHQDGMVHGDVKPRNVVRVGEGHEMRLIDFDMSFHIGMAETDAMSRPGAVRRFSSSPTMEAPEQIGATHNTSLRVCRTDTSDCEYLLSSISNSELQQNDCGSDKTLALHASRRKLIASDAYASPEAARWLLETDDSRGGAASSNKIIDMLECSERVDLWSFGVLAFELFTGIPLFDNSYDTLSAKGGSEILSWKGLPFDRVQDIERIHGRSGDVRAAVDMLQWLLDETVHNRPRSMDEVLQHAFFDTQHGTMREHFVVDAIRAELPSAASDEDSPNNVSRLLSTPCSDTERPLKKVMISYSWTDSKFVLNRLALALAPYVEHMWLDRLGGDHGMGVWARDSMRRGVEECDVVIAVVSPAYIQSKNCGFEMAVAMQSNKDIVPLVLGVPFSAWPPASIGGEVMTTQFADSATGDVKLFVDFTNPEEFDTKLWNELVPMLRKPTVPVSAAPKTWARAGKKVMTVTRAWQPRPTQVDPRRGANASPQDTWAESTHPTPTASSTILTTREEAHEHDAPSSDRDTPSAASMHSAQGVVTASDGATSAPLIDPDSGAAQELSRAWRGPNDDAVLPSVGWRQVASLSDIGDGTDLDAPELSRRDLHILSQESIL